MFLRKAMNRAGAARAALVCSSRLATQGLRTCRDLRKKAKRLWGAWEHRSIRHSLTALMRGSPVEETQNFQPPSGV